MKHASLPLTLVSCLLLLAETGCSGDSAAPPAADSGARDATTPDAAVDSGIPTRDATTPDAPADTAAPACDGSVPADAGPTPGSFCALPGSVLWTGDCASPHVVPGGSASAPDLTWLNLPAGFCAHYYGTVGDARQLRVAPGGEIFVASPTSATTGGNTSKAVGGIVVLPDDNHDGVADQNIVFKSGLASVQGLMFANGSFYYQDDVNIMSVPYKSGDRQPSGTPQLVTTITEQQAPEHWPKVFDQASDGTIYISNGGSQADETRCLSSWPTRGSILALGDAGADGGAPTSVVSIGFRNPIAMRCESKHNVCLVTELALDYSAQHGGREKLVPVRPGDNWGYPCCATQNLPYDGVTYKDGDGGIPDCSNVAPESDSFIIGNTPFGVDFETGKWPAPWTDRVFVTLHGAAGSWSGARLVSIGLDPATGLPLPGTELEAGSAGNSLLEFATGWDDGTRRHGRPAPITFAPDGRMFVGNDNDGTVVWIAPIDLPKQ